MRNILHNILRLNNSSNCKIFLTYIFRFLFKFSTFVKFFLKLYNLQIVLKLVQALIPTTSISKSLSYDFCEVLSSPGLVGNYKYNITVCRIRFVIGIISTLLIVSSKINNLNTIDYWSRFEHGSISFTSHQVISCHEGSLTAIYSTIIFIALII